MPKTPSSPSSPLAAVVSFIAEAPAALGALLFPAAATARLRQDHRRFEQLRAHLREELVAAGVKLDCEPRIFGRPVDAWPGGVFSVGFTVPTRRIAIPFEEPVKSARAQRLVAAREAAVVAAGWKQIAISTEDVADPERLHLCVRRVLLAQSRPRTRRLVPRGQAV